MEIEMIIKNYKKEDIGFPQDIKHYMKNTKNLTIRTNRQLKDELYMIFSNENEKNGKNRVK